MLDLDVASGGGFEGELERWRVSERRRRLEQRQRNGAAEAVVSTTDWRAAAAARFQIEPGSDTMEDFCILVNQDLRMNSHRRCQGLLWPFVESWFQCFTSEYKGPENIST
ncbi:hypothetical protein AKJ16_DCAP04829 [Drosera capensis]